MAHYIQVVTTTETKAEAQTIASATVEERLAACAQIIGPITSTYWWQGKIETAEDWLCVLKSKETLYEELERAIQKLHPYKEPEILAISIAKGKKTYLDWLDENVRKP